MKNLKQANNKVFISLMLAILMIFGIISPVFASVENNAQKSTATVTIEYIDENGTPTYMLTPTKVEIEEGMTAIDALNIAYQDKGEVTYSSIKGITVKPNDSEAIGEVGWGKKAWWPFANSTKVGNKYTLEDNDVFRLIYTQDSKVGFEGYIPPSAEGIQGKLSVDKDELLRGIASLTQEQIDKNQEKYNEIIAIAIDLKAEATQINSAIKDLDIILNPSVSATDIEISPESLEMNIGEKQQLTAKVYPENSDDVVVWSSSDSKIADITEDGFVYANAEGEVSITAQANENVKKSITVKVNGKPSESISLNKNEVSIEVGKSERLIASVLPVDTTDVVTWESENPDIAYVDDTGMIVGKSAGNTIITATSGDNSVKCNVNVTEREVSDNKKVIFKHTDGRITELDDNNTITLSMIDEGRFELEGYEEDVNPYWECSEKKPNDESSTIHISSGGNFYPYIGERKATVYTKNPDLWEDAEEITTFNLKVTKSDITQLQVYLDGKRIDENNTIYLKGTETKQVTVKGKVGDTNLFVSIPNQALDLYATNDGIIYKDYDENMIHFSTTSDESVYTICLIEDSDVKVQFKASSKKIDVESMTVEYPEVFYIDRWNGLGNQYVGITSHGVNKEDRYTINFHPYNATVKDVQWISHNPEIAEFQETYNNGIVPKKAGIAKFTVISKDNPEVKQDITIEFKYKNPLESVSLDKKEYNLSQYDSIELDINKVPENATNQRFIWSYSKDGIVKVTDSVIKEDTSNVNTPLITKHTLSATGVGTVTVTGVPIDETNSIEPIVFDVTVTENSENVDLDFDKYVTQNIDHSINYLTDGLEGNYIYGSEWNIFTILRAGGELNQTDLNTYYNSVVKELNSGDRILPTDYFRIVTTLIVMGKDPTNVEGINIIERMYNYANLDRMSSNMMTYTLMSYDAKNYEIPSDALWTRDTLIEKILSFQNQENGGFGLSNNKTVSVDITAMTLQGLAPYNNDNYPEVQKAFEKALDYLRNEMLSDCGYFVEGADNGCSAAQVLTALSVAGIDPLNKENGFTKGKNNLVSKLNDFKLESGFTTFGGSKTPDIMASSQIGYALEAYRRFANGENSLYDLTDVKEIDQSQIDQEMANKVIDLINNIGEVTKDSGNAISEARKAYDNLTENQKKLVTNYNVLLEAEKAFEKLNGNSQTKPEDPSNDNQANNNQSNNQDKPQKDNSSSQNPKTADDFSTGLLMILVLSSAGLMIIVSKKYFKIK